MNISYYVSRLCRSHVNFPDKLLHLHPTAAIQFLHQENQEIPLPLLSLSLSRFITPCTAAVEGMVHLTLFPRQFFFLVDARENIKHAGIKENCANSTCHIFLKVDY